MHSRPRREAGFSLVELLVVLVVIGVLAGVVVFVVRGVSDDASSKACDADARVLVVAEDAYNAVHGRYATEAELVTAGALRRQSQLNDIELSADDFTVVTVAGCATGDLPGPPASTLADPPPPAPSTTTTTIAATTTIATTTSTSTTTTNVATTTTSTTSSTTTTTLAATTSTSTTLAPTTTANPATTPTHLVFSVQPSDAPVNAAISPPIRVAVRNAADVTLAGNTATVTLGITSGTGSPAGRLTCQANPVAAVDGIATFVGCAVSKSTNAAYTLTATSPGLASAVSAPFRIT